jgi:potassium channel subfamily K
MYHTLTYLQISLVTIGYGDYAPKTGAGRTFYIIWSFLAVPTMTILASHLTDTVISAFNSWSHTVADHTLLPKYGRWRQLLKSLAERRISLPWSKARQQNSEVGNERFDLQRTQTVQNEMYAAGLDTPDIDAIQKQRDRDLEGRQPDAAALARQLALAIRRTAKDMLMETPRQYSYEEWVEFTRLIRFSAVAGPSEALEDEGMVEWDWLAENSPMMAEHTEAEFVLERLCESLVRYLRRNPPLEVFSGILKEKGEDVLRLKDGGWSGVLGDKVEQSTPNPESSTPSSAALKKQKSPTILHPLEEEEH